ncbi:MAG: serine/threonine protein kinase, partial [Acidobacteria bacterium]|nr:serine/threonine protein kinase [Acidobacteriota bacterium]
MTERWPELKRLFHATLKHAPEQRAAFLEEACGADFDLRAEVERLLAAHEAGASPLSPGTALGPYEIVGLIGAGGMGEVYQARDPRLKRDVAIKLISPALATDPDRLRRFEQEAQAVAALTHPNILAIYDIGTVPVHRDPNVQPPAGARYLVTELLTGTTLRTLVLQGPLPVQRALDIGRSIAQGLAAAHDKHIIHRDLKPENLFITDDGRVKILDFGLAKLLDIPGPTETTAVGTQSGMVL